MYYKKIYKLILILTVFLIFLGSNFSFSDTEKIFSVNVIKINSRPKKLKNPLTETYNKLLKFFKHCKIDTNNAKNIIIEKDMVKNLTHLQKMGGKRYYILERENFTRIINSVTQNVYTDFIIINRSGKIIYTKSNNFIFAKHVKGRLKLSPFNSCYVNRNDGLFIHDTKRLSFFKNRIFIFFSTKVKGKNSFPGIFILQCDIFNIKKLLKKKIHIIDRNGIYRISLDNKKIGEKFKYFDKINLKSNDEKTINISKNKFIKYKFFNFRNISWILIYE